VINARDVERSTKSATNAGGVSQRNVLNEGVTNIGRVPVLICQLILEFQSNVSLFHYAKFSLREQMLIIHYKKLTLAVVAV